jgi:hypothetical protein
MQVDEVVDVARGVGEQRVADFSDITHRAIVGRVPKTVGVERFALDRTPIVTCEATVGVGHGIDIKLRLFTEHGCIEIVADQEIDESFQRVVAQCFVSMHATDDRNLLLKSSGRWIGDLVAEEVARKDHVPNIVESARRLADLKKQGVAGGVYTQTTDVEGEINGLMTYDRKVLKLSAEELEQIHIDAGIIPSQKK